jgi:3-dehydroquinate dehydratase-2
LLESRTSVGFNAAREMSTTEKGGVQADAGASASSPPATVLVIHGPNLNLLGHREPEIYGRTRLADIDRSLKQLGRELGIKVDTFQSNSEGAIVDRIQRARGRARALVINPAAYTHTSVAIRDAITACDLPAIEVHLSNVYSREPFRHQSTSAGIVVGRIMGFGAEGYLLALRAAKRLIDIGAQRAAAGGA